MSSETAAYLFFIKLFWSRSNFVNDSDVLLTVVFLFRGKKNVKAELMFRSVNPAGTEFFKILDLENSSMKSKKLKQVRKSSVMRS